MARPALVIGLGGTGQWVLTFLKKDLLEIGNGEMPPGVRLLAFDTTKHPSAKTGHDDGGHKDPSDTRVRRAGTVELQDRIEFIHFGSDVSDLVDEINQGQHPHLAWFKASDALRKLPRAAFNADDGAGAIRHIGRLSFMKDVQSRTTSRIISTIEKAFDRIEKDSKITVQNRLEIIIVSSLAGGTGAGILVDMAMICRAIAESRYTGNIVVRGFIITPRAFASGTMGQGNEMLARSFAAWRELDRMLVTSKEYGANVIRYSLNDPSLKLQSTHRLFDSTYIIDPMRENLPLDIGHPEDGLFPAVANVISAILDNTAGRVYSEQVINLSDTYFRLPLTPTHSAVGSYMMKVPVYYARQKFTYSLGKEVLDILLAPVLNDRQHVIGLADNKNAEVDQSKVGLNAALDFLNADSIKLDGKDYPNTMLGKLIARIRLNKGQEDGNILNAVARGGLSRRGAEFINAMLDITEDEQGQAIIQEVTPELTFQIWHKVKPSREHGDTPAEAFNRISNNLARERLARYGSQEGQEGMRGSFGDGLDKAKWAQVRLYTAALQAWTESTLNGFSVNPRQGRGGKLGYVKSVYKNLIDTFTYFIGFLAEVHRVRAETLNIEERASRAETAALQNYNHLKSRNCWVTFWDQNVHPEAHRAQRHFLRQAQAAIDVRKDNILLAIVEETVREMQAITQAAMDDLRQWEIYLATGEVKAIQQKDGSIVEVETKSLYQLVQEELNNVEVNHELDKSLTQVSRIVGEHAYQTDASFVEDRLSKIRWKVERDLINIPRADGSVIHKPHGLKISLSLSDPQPQILFNQGETAHRSNLNFFITMIEQSFAGLAGQHSFGQDILLDPDLNTGKKMADHVYQKADPLWRKTSTGVGPRHSTPRSAIVRVNSKINDETVQYYKDFVWAWEQLKDNAGVRMILAESDDRYKQTIVRFDDVIESKDFDIWEICRKAYLQMLTDQRSELKPADLHVFLPEINACKYEEKISRTLKGEAHHGGGYRPLHPSLVALLENEQRIEMFFRALALDFIKKEWEEDGTTRWVYQLPGRNRMHLTEDKTNFGETGEEDYYRLINQFVVHAKDVRPGYASSNWVDWENLEKEIRNAHRKMSAKELEEFYMSQAAKPGGMIAELRDNVARRRSEVPDLDERKKIGLDLLDLADLAETIYRIAAKTG